jgi:hypothetical protein
MFERFTADARNVVVVAQEQARTLDHCWIGTEHILLALARSRGIAARVLRDFDLDHGRLLGATVALLGTAHRDGAPDPQALESIGIDLDAVRRRVEETFGPGALERALPRSRRRRRGVRHIPFTGRAKKALERALRESPSPCATATSAASTFSSPLQPIAPHSQPACWPVSASNHTPSASASTTHWKARPTRLSGRVVGHDCRRTTAGVMGRRGGGCGGRWPRTASRGCRRGDPRRPPSRSGASGSATPARSDGRSAGRATGTARPIGLVTRVHDELVSSGYRQLTDWLRGVLADQGRSDEDATAMAAVALGALVHYREDQAIYGHPPAGADEQSFIKVWVDLWAHCLPR